MNIRRIKNRRTEGHSTHTSASFFHTSLFGGINGQILNCPRRFNKCSTGNASTLSAMLPPAKLLSEILAGRRHHCSKTIFFLPFFTFSFFIRCCIYLRQSLRLRRQESQRQTEQHNVQGMKSHGCGAEHQSGNDQRKRNLCLGFSLSVFFLLLPPSSPSLSFLYFPFLSSPILPIDLSLLCALHRSSGRATIYRWATESDKMHDDPSTNPHRHSHASNVRQTEESGFTLLAIQPFSAGQ